VAEGHSVPDALDLGKIPQGKEINLEEDFELVWWDEFEGTELDRSKWGFSWWITERKGGYWHEDMVSVKDGNLVIRAEYLDEPLENYYADKFPNMNMPEYKPGWYTGKVTTRGLHEFLYGYFEVRCILPAATGMWSAFWMMNEGVYNVDNSGEDGTEVDVFESFYYKDHWWGNDAISTGIHYDGYDERTHHGEAVGKMFIANNPYEEYNTYGVEWNEDEYIFYINGVETRRSSFGNGVSEVMEDVIVSLEIPEENELEGLDKETYKTEYIVDYVKIYQK
jgi:beta-glucanase (GH16 family)